MPHAPKADASTRICVDSLIKPYEINGISHFLQIIPVYFLMLSVGDWNGAISEAITHIKSKEAIQKYETISK